MYNNQIYETRLRFFRLKPENFISLAFRFNYWIWPIIYFMWNVNFRNREHPLLGYLRHLQFFFEVWEFKIELETKAIKSGCRTAFFLERFTLILRKNSWCRTWPKRQTILAFWFFDNASTIVLSDDSTKTYVKLQLILWRHKGCSWEFYR